MYSTCVHTASQNMPKYASFGYKKMSKSNLIFGHPKNHPNFSNFFDSKNVHNYTGQEFDNELRPKLNNNFLTDGKFSISTLIDKIVNFLLTAGKFLFSSLTDKIFEEHLISPSVPLRQIFQASKKRGGCQRIAENIWMLPSQSFRIFTRMW